MTGAGAGGERGWAGSWGTCLAWQLPADATCARVARRLYTEAVTDLGLPGESVEDGTLMTSELAANALHACSCGGGGQPGSTCSPVVPELWLYLRGTGYPGSGRELVCKVFDGCSGWTHGVAQALGNPRPLGEGDVGGVDVGEVESGRGLQVVNELSGGQWGIHLTRARLDGLGSSGKAAWFAQPLAAVAQPPQVAWFTALRGQMSAVEAAGQLEEELTARGFGGRLVRADDPAGDIAVVSVSDGLAIWCRGGMARLRIPWRDDQRWPYLDLVEVTEQAVRAHEELRGTLARPVAARTR